MTGLRAIRTLAPQAPPAGIYESKYTPDLAAEICSRLAAGESLRSICRCDPAMPTAKTVWNWVQRRPEFAWSYEQALLTARTAARTARRARTEAKKAEKAATRAARGWRPTPPWPDTYSLMEAETICWRLAKGETLQAICRDPAMPSVATVYNWLERYAAFRAEYVLAREVAVNAIVSEAHENSHWLGSDWASTRARAHAVKAATRQAMRLWPRGFAGPPLRRDVEARLVRTLGDGSTEIEIDWVEPKER